MTSAALTPVRCGFVPLIDCALPVIAHEQGFAEQQGLALELVREASWAAIRDKVAFGVLDAAHLLAGIPLACAVGAARAPQVGMLALMALGRGGNSITVSSALYRRMVEADPVAMAGPRAQSAQALRKVIDADRAAGRPPLSFATVFPVSSHNFELRYWLASAGIDPDLDLNLGIIAPPRMVESLALGHIDGYCVGEPWGQRAVAKGVGAIIATKSDLFPAAPEKVLGVRTAWAEQQGDVAEKLIRAFVQAAQWADDPDNRETLAALLAREDYLGQSDAAILASLRGEVILRAGEPATVLPGSHVFYHWQATFPWLSHGHWLMAQMQRWGLWSGDLAERARIVSSVYRPDLYRRAVAPLGIPLPVEDMRVEGGHLQPFQSPAEGGGMIDLGPDIFMDGRLFDPARSPV